MAEHTPTPWSLHDRWLMSPSGPVALASGYQDWVTAPGGDRFEEWKANAAFIVKAVNSHETLLKTLQIARLMIAGEIIEHAVIDTQTRQSLGDAIDAAVNAVVGGAPK